MIRFFRREFWMADDELSAHIVMPFRRDGELVAAFAAVPGVVAVVLLIVAVMTR